jgi:very-short-patch-repair endonuclease
VSSAAATTPASSSRIAAVDRARAAWISRLIDLSQRNNLLYYRPLKVGTLDLTMADNEVLAELLSGKSVGLKKLLPQADPAQTLAQAKEIARKAKENFEERGLETLYLAAGMATWQGEEGKRPPESGVLLVPISLDARGRTGATLKRAGEPQINPVLLHVLNSSFRCPVTSEVLLAAADTDPDRDDDPFNLDALLAKLVEVAEGIPKFEVRRRIVLGNFSFQKMAMVRDLNELGQQLAENDIIAGLAGDLDARGRVTSRACDLDPREFDRTPPQEEFLVLDTDATQQKAIRMAQAGQSLVIQGPPGTGKSQVIANLIVASAAAGKRVLFVAEKRAALQVVLDRLNRCNLGCLALDLHGADTSRKVIAGRLRDALANIDRGARVASDQILEPFAQRRQRLNQHAQLMHQKRPPADLSVFEMQAQLVTAAMRAAPALKARFRGPALMRLNSAAVSDAKDALREAAAMGPLFLGTLQSPWTSATYSDGHAAQAAIDLAQQLADDAWPALKELIARILQPVRPVAPTNIDELVRLLQLAVRANEHLKSFDASIFSLDLDGTIAALQPATGGVVKRAWATLISPRYRRAKALVAASAKAPLGTSAMLEWARKSRELLEEWRQAGFASPAPAALPAADDALRTAQSFAQRLNDLGRGLNRSDPGKLPLATLETLLAALRDDAATARRIPGLRRVEAKLDSHGLGAFVAELRRANPPGDAWPAALERAWLTSCIEHVWAEEPDLASFNGQVHGKYAAEFCQLDRQRLDLAAAQAAKRHVQEAAKLLAELSDQAARVRHEAEKKIRHLPFRKLMETSSDVLAAMFPCFMCSPLSVSQLLPGDRKLFDAVIFDEASQVLPEDAVASLVRGAQAVVAGDEHQLPPTQFFAGGTEDEQDDADDEEPGASQGFESLLKMMKSFVPAPMLEWHYRSRDERLIAFSNHHIYDGRLITFPSPAAGDGAVKHILVQDEGNASGAAESDSDEVRRVVELVLEHAAQEVAKPSEHRRSLGVIALGIPHARRIEAAIDRALEERADLEPFFDPSLPERFFVKNLERVQGDERDVILLTLGISPDRAGKVELTRFGPLNNREQGYRRLNVAITRTRRSMIVVSSFNHHAIDVSKQVSRGVELMRNYLQYASDGGALGEQRGRSEVAPNAFEADIADALSGAGITTVPQWGASSYRIDLVAQHPTRPGRLVLAIECDGATYHSFPTARDRDRLRQQHLEALGWKFHRIWSTDWFVRRDEEMARAVRAFHDAVAHADRCDAAPTVPA